MMPLKLAPLLLALFGVLQCAVAAGDAPVPRAAKHHVLLQAGFETSKTKAVPAKKAIETDDSRAKRDCSQFAQLDEGTAGCAVSWGKGKPTAHIGAAVHGTSRLQKATVVKKVVLDLQEDDE